MVESFNIGYKFDINEIKTDVIVLDGPRTSAAKTVVSPIDNTTWAPEQEAAEEEIALPFFSGFAPKVKADEATLGKILAYLNTNNVGKQIFDYVLAPDANGQFTRTILDQRGLWNATDTDYEDAKMQQVNTMGQKR